MSRHSGPEGKCAPCPAANGGIHGPPAAGGTSFVGPVPGIEAFAAAFFGLGEQAGGEGGEGLDLDQQRFAVRGPPDAGAAGDPGQAPGVFSPGCLYWPNYLAGRSSSRRDHQVSGRDGTDRKPGQFNAAFGIHASAVAILFPPPSNT